MVNPVSDPRSVGEYDLVGISSMATSPLEIMVCPVVPAGMLDFATTADVVTGATTVVPEPACLLAPSTLAYAMALPATNSSTPIMTSMSVCLFTEPSPSQPTDERAVHHALTSPLAPLEGTTGRGRGT